jgi:hypothetical protein
MRKSLLTMLGVAALSLATTANAAVVVVGGGTTVDVTGPTTSDGGINFSLGYSDSGSTSPFTETLQWNNTLSGIYGVTLTTIAAVVNGENDVDITNAFLTGGSIMGSLGLTPDVGSTDLNESYSLMSTLLDAGTYTLTIEGTRGTTGSFGGNVAFTAASVPEPATWGMMLLGFGAVGFAMRRRRTPVMAQIA